MSYNFDKIVNRRNTSSMKWNNIKNEDSIAIGIADMDFHTPDVVVDEIKKVADFGVYGYVVTGEGYYDSFIDWSKRRYNWEVSEEWLSYTPGVIAAMGSAVRAFSDVGDQVIYQTPAFYLFNELTVTNGREPVHNSLIYQDGKYTIDFEDLERKAQNPRAKIFLLCNPQNPSCRVFTKEELLRIGEICLKNNVIIVSDEVHCDIVYKPYKHIPIASLSEELAHNTVTCFSATKTFNMAGLQISVNVIPNPEMRKKYELELLSRDSKRPNIFAMCGMRAAYAKGEPWLEELLLYIKGNVEFLTDFISTNLPDLKVIKPEGTYLIWVDCSKLGISGEELGDFFAEKANVFVSAGSGYGEEGNDFIRINPACPRAVLEEALKRMEKAIATRSEMK
ncbi:MalY/PatB family protein [Priestia megaterium]|uniref:MalY/PatB family protein n=1 Tax=Priestia megaterium TaxID=1404 RepID=UPI002570EC0A|nr:MalY/PatB family protein [Priestia megaterium]WJD83576.1 MalY/PatB family protein [Priestia megaterium]